MATRIASGLTLEEVGESAFRAFAHALGGQADCDGLSAIHRAAWRGLGRGAELALLRCEWSGYLAAARELHQLFLDGVAALGADAPWPGGIDDVWGHQAKGLAAGDRVAWEAVARHLHTVFDGEGSEEIVDDLEALESSWREWARKRLAAQSEGK